MVSTYMFPPDALPPQVSDETKDQKIMHKDMKDFWNSVLDLLVYSKCPIKVSVKENEVPTEKKF